MCGIAGMYLHEAPGRPMSRRKVERLVNNLLLGIENRGRHATGFACIDADGEITVQKMNITASDFIKARRLIPAKPRTILLHTRFATQGAPEVEANNHPIEYDDILVTHNGHINNDAEIFREFKLKRNAEVDSEAIAALFQHYGIEKAHLPLQNLEGGFAVAVADARHPETLVLAKGWSSPLTIHHFEHGLVWASTDHAIKSAMEKTFGDKPNWKSMQSAGVGDIYYIQPGDINRYDFKPAYTKTRSYSRTYTPGGNTPSWWGYSSDDYGSDSSYDYLDNLPPVRTPLGDTTPNSEEGVSYIPLGDGTTLTFRECDHCNSQFNEIKMTNLGNWWFCNTCFTEDDDPADWEDWLDDLFESHMEDSEAKVEEEHKVVCQLVGEKHKLGGDFVEWILFSKEQELISDDPILAEARDMFDKEYDEIMRELTSQAIEASTKEETRYLPVVRDDSICANQSYNGYEDRTAVEVS